MTNGQLRRAEKTYTRENDEPALAIQGCLSTYGQLGVQMVARMHGHRVQWRCNMVILIGELVVRVVSGPGVARA